MTKAKSLYSIMNEIYIPEVAEGEMIIYFLIRDDEIIYVGQTKDLNQRLSQHSTKGFDRYNFIVVDSNHADVIESLYIHSVNPEMNSDMTHHALKFKTREKRAPLSIDRIAEMLCDHIDAEGE